MYKDAGKTNQKKVKNQSIEIDQAMTQRIYLVNNDDKTVI